LNRAVGAGFGWRLAPKGRFKLAQANGLGEGLPA
jgi:hypothetical protein